VSNIFWTLSESAQVTIDIHKPSGAYLLTLASEFIDPGDWYIQWPGTNRFGRLVPRGTHFYVIRATDPTGNTSEVTGTTFVRRPRRR
jgi:hypothetical protein